MKAINAAVVTDAAGAGRIGSSDSVTGARLASASTMSTIPSGTRTIRRTALRMRDLGFAGLPLNACG
jgi:hypothetical protein